MIQFFFNSKCLISLYERRALMNHSDKHQEIAELKAKLASVEQKCDSL